MKTCLGYLRACAFASVLVLASQPVSAVVLSLEPDVAAVGVGDPLAVSLVVDGLTAGGPDSLGDFDVDVAFDPAALSFTGLTLGASLGDPGLFEALDFSQGDLGGGRVNVAESSLLEADSASCVLCVAPFLDELQGSRFTLATLTFDVALLAPGATTAISIDAVNALGDAFGQPLPLDAARGAVVTGTQPPVAVSAPGTLLLLAGGLGLLVGRRPRHG